MDMSLGLVTAYFDDLERARAFYVEKLGLHVVPEFTGPSFVYLRAGSIGLALRPLRDAVDGAQSGVGSIELSFLVADVHATRAELVNNGVEVTSEVGDVGAGLAFIARDPEGHMLAFAQLTTEIRAQRERRGM